MAPGRRPKGQWREAISALEERIGHVFSNRELIEAALTHVSAVSGEGQRVLSYQRLEFLGDHVLGLVVSDMLFKAFPKEDEGALSRRLAELVRAETCAEIAESLNMGLAMRIGPSEVQSGGRTKKPILADVCEAVIGALYAEAGYEPAAAFIERHWLERMQHPRRPLRDAKTRLQEWVQAKALPVPTYKEISREGPDHAPTFRIAVVIEGLEGAEALGASKREAEQAAANAVLVREGVSE